jgi:hypothetical protein
MSTMDDVRSAVRENQKRAPYLSDWQHVKSGGIYAVKQHVIIEATLEPAVVYYKRHADPAETWVRPASEFFDGRFVRVEK